MSKSGEDPRLAMLRSLMETTLAASNARSFEDALRAITDGARILLEAFNQH